ncbi:TPA: hypothetical protein EYG84_00925, partial [Candidatus Gracilibacteria bacterium]|nr:hypothetical protein [Candidatus Gracilibacteria bacterium]
MSNFNTNNAFKKTNVLQKKKSFIDKHGTIVGGGVLAFGLMIVGAQYSVNTNFSADITDEETQQTEEITEEITTETTSEEITEETTTETTSEEITEETTTETT